MKTRSQKLREQQEGHPASPPRSLEDIKRPRGAVKPSANSRRNRTALVPSSSEPSTSSFPYTPVKSSSALSITSASHKSSETLALKKTSPPIPEVPTHAGSSKVHSPYKPSARTPGAGRSPITNSPRVVNTPPREAILVDSAQNANPTSPQVTSLKVISSASPAPVAPCALLQLWVDAKPEDFTSGKPPRKPDILRAIPLAVLCDLLQLINYHPAMKSQKELTISTAVTSASISSSSVTPSSISTPSTSHKRKLPEDAETSQSPRRPRIEFPNKDTVATESSLTPRRPRTRGMFSRKPLQALSEQNYQSSTDFQRHQRDSTSPAGILGKAGPYAQNDCLLLGSGPESDHELQDPEIEESLLFNGQEWKPGGVMDDSPTEELNNGTSNFQDSFSAIESNQTDAKHSGMGTSPHTLDITSLETPRVSRWALSGLLSTATRSVAKYIPGLSSRSVDTKVGIPDPAAELSNSHPSPRPRTPPNDLTDHHATQSEPRQALERVDEIAVPATTNVRCRQNRQKRKTPKKLIKSIEDINAMRAKRAEKEFLRSQTAFVMETDALRAEAAQANKANREKAEASMTAGGKRKRLPSPESIPNPPNSSFGLDLNYFGYDSSDDDEGPDENTPIRQRPSKSRRLNASSGSHRVMLGDNKRAQPYTGVVFAGSGQDYHGGNIFSEMLSNEKAQKKIIEERSLANSSKTPTGNDKRNSPQPQQAPFTGPKVITNLAGSFRVPSPSDSDSDPEELDELRTESPSPSKVSKEPINGAQDFASHPIISLPGKATNNVTFAPNEHPPLSVAKEPAKSPVTWTQPPPPRPKPSHAALPSITSNDSEALAKARKKALQHQPSKPSTLRQSSRSSSPRIPLAEEHAGAETTSQTFQSIPVSSVSQDTNKTAHTLFTPGSATKSFQGFLAGNVPPQNAFNAPQIASSSNIATSRPTEAVQNSLTDNNKTLPKNIFDGAGVSDATKNNQGSMFSSVSTTPLVSLSSSEAPLFPNPQANSKAIASQNPSTNVGAEELLSSRANNSTVKPPQDLIPSAPTKGRTALSVINFNGSNASQEYSRNLSAKVADLVNNLDLDSEALGDYFSRGVAKFASNRGNGTQKYPSVSEPPAALSLSFPKKGMEMQAHPSSAPGEADITAA